MNRVIDGVWVAVLSLAIGTGSSAAAAGLASDPIVMAVRRGDCSKAIRELNAEVNANQSQTALFVGGRMLDEGICMHKAGIDPKSQVSFYSLGYACTVRAVAGRLQRESSPTGAFHTPTAPAIVEFRLQGDTFMNRPAGSNH